MWRVNMSYIKDMLKQNKKIHFSLIDPDKQTPIEAGQIAKKCNDFGTDAIMIGGSTINNRNLVYNTIEEIKKKVILPIILFPNSVESISENVEYILFMMLLNSLESKYRGEEQAKGAPLVKKWGIKPISTGYVVISTSQKPTTIEQIVKLDKINSTEIEKAVDYALIAEMIGMSCVYFDAGSGAEKPIPNEMINAIRENISIPIIIGGGINNKDIAEEKIKAGADAIVNGTILENGNKDIESIIKIVHST
jgi:phosphoglycerol geranylgeranyltransferase